MSSSKRTSGDRPRFRDVALRSKLLSEQQVSVAESELRIVMTGPDVAAEAWDRAVADIHVRKRELTKFQSRELLAGRSRFHLGPYVVFDELGRGGMGQVFKAEHLFMGRHVAIKVLPRAKATPESEAAFQREMRILGRLQHENIVQALDAGYDAMVYYLVTELVSGLDLRKQVVKYGPLSDLAAASVIAQAAQGLAYAHAQGIVHRDVKPGNLLVRKDGRVKVLDLGLAGSMLEEESMRLGRVVGTMDYIAPEQIRSADTVGPTADIYALGCTLYYAVTGQVPFPGGTRREKMQRHLSMPPVPVRELAARLSPEFCRVIEAMMAKDPAERIASAGEVAERLRRWVPDAPQPAPRRDRATGQEPGRVGPPPLPEEPPRGLAWLSRWASQDPPTPVRRRDDDVPWLLPDRQAATDAVRSLGPRLVESFRWPAGGRVLTGLVQAAVIAAVGGLLFGCAMAAVSQIDPGRFRQMLRGFGPVPLGWMAFVVLLILQLPAAIAGRPPRH